MKYLSKNDIPQIVKMRDEGLKYEEIAIKLTAQGYATGNNKPLSRSEVSNFMCQHGYRTYKTKRTHKNKAQQPVSSDVEVLEDLLSSNLSKDSKQRFIDMFIQNKKG